jgi:hypothetical protein
MMLERKNPDVIGKNTVVDRVWETRHEITAHICVDNAPTIGRRLNHSNGALCRIEKFSTETANSPIVELRRWMSSASVSGW